MMKHFNTTPKNAMAGSFVFLLLGLPFGILYFTLTLLGFSLGLGTLVIWIGIPILFATLGLIRGMAVVERRLVTNLLHIPIPEQASRDREPQTSFIRRFGSYLRDPLTWTSMIYMLLKLPLGIISFTLVVTLPIVAGSILLLPVVYLVNLFVNSILLANGIHSSSYIIPYFIEIHGQFDIVMFLRSFVGVPVGLVLWFATQFILSGFAQASGELARAMLSPFESANPAQPRQAYTYPQPNREEPLYAYQEMRQQG